MAERFRIIIADDHTLLREGLRRILADESDLVVSGEASDGDELLRLLRQAGCDLLLLDLSMPGTSGLDVLEVLKPQYPNLKVLALTMHADRSTFRRAIAGGVDGYILKGESHDQLLAAIRAIIEGGRWISREMQALLVDDYNTLREGRQSLDVLTRREKQILRLVALGKMNKEIAHDLDISKRTVEFHRANIMDKLNLRNLTDLVKFAIDQGLL